MTRQAEQESQGPPKTGIAAPVIGPASSEQSQRITRATWSVVTHFEKFAFGIASRFDGVSVIRGMTQFTSTFAAFSSCSISQCSHSPPDYERGWGTNFASPHRPVPSDHSRSALLFPLPARGAA